MLNRPSPTATTHDPAELAALFANVVTTPSEMAYDWVARNGDKSIFTAFRMVLPEVSDLAQHCQRRLGWGLIGMGPDSLTKAGLSTWLETTTGKGHSRSNGAEQDSTVSTRIRV